MEKHAPHEVTGLLRAWCDGNQEALNQLIPLVYDELHRLAHHYMRGESPDHILQTSALVNEAYLRLIDAQQVQWEGRAHFFAISANLMRRILVDFARSKQNRKFGNHWQKIEIDTSYLQETATAADLVALDEALTALADMDPRAAKVVEMRFFNRLTVEEEAQALGVSPRSVNRDLEAASIWLLSQMAGDAAK